MLLELRDVTKSFGRNAVLRHVSLRAETGYCVGVVGRNGERSQVLGVLVTTGRKITLRFPLAPTYFTVY